MQTSSRFLVLTIAMLTGGAARAQVVSDPNQIQGHVRFTNTNPSVLAVLRTFRMDGTARASSPLGSASTDFRGDGVEGTFELSVQADPAGVVHFVQVDMDLANDGDPWSRDDYDTQLRNSPPVHPEPAPDVPMEFEECVALVHLLAIDTAGVPRTWPSSSAVSRTANRVIFSHLGEGLAEEWLILPPDSDPWSVEIQPSGFEPVTAPIGTLSCDQIRELTLTLVPEPPRQTCTVTGEFDVVGETESTGWWDNRRATRIKWLISSFQYESAPAEGPFLIPDALAGNASLTATTSLRAGSRFQRVSIDRQCRCEAGTVVDLGGRFVMDPVALRGDIEIAAPPDRPGAESAARGIERCAARVPTTSDELSRCSCVVARGRPVDGSVASAWTGTTIGLFAGDYDLRSEAFEGDYDLVAAAPDRIESRFDAHALKLSVRRSSGTAMTTIAEYVSIDNALIPRQVLMPGQAAVADHDYCSSELQVQFTQTFGSFESPSVQGHGSFAGTDFRGNPADYDVSVDQGLGYVDRATGVGWVNLLLPQGDYALGPQMDIRNPGGGTTHAALPGFNVSVGCRETHSLFSTLRIHITAGVPTCSSDVLALEGVVEGGSSVTTLTWRTESASPTVLCSPCGIDPAFSADIPLPAGDTNVIVEATDDTGRVASASVTTRHAPEPSALDLHAGALPLTVTRTASGLHVAWEATRFDTYAVHRGTLASLWQAGAYDHVRISPCGLSAVAYDVEDAGAGSYFIVTSDCGLGTGSFGRDSRGFERPASPNNCP